MKDRHQKVKNAIFRKTNTNKIFGNGYARPRYSPMRLLHQHSLTGLLSSQPSATVVEIVDDAILSRVYVNCTQ